MVAFLSTSGTSPFGDLARQTLGDGGLADAGVTDIDRVVLRAPAQHLDGAAQLGIAPDQRIDLAGLGLGVEVDAEIGQRRTLAVPLALGPTFAMAIAGPLFGAAHGALLVGARLGDAMGDEIDRVEPAHVLLFEEVGGVALALGKDRDQHVGAGHFFLARRLHVDHGALNDALERGSRTRVLPVGHDEAVELFIDKVFEIALERLDVHVAPRQDGDGVAVVGQGQQQVLERGEFMCPFARQVHRLMQGLFQSA